MSEAGVESDLEKLVAQVNNILDLLSMKEYTKKSKVNPNVGLEQVLIQ